MQYTIPSEISLPRKRVTPETLEIPEFFTQDISKILEEHESEVLKKPKFSPHQDKDAEIDKMIQEARETSSLESKENSTVKITQIIYESSDILMAELRNSKSIEIQQESIPAGPIVPHSDPTEINQDPYDVLTDAIEKQPDLTSSPLESKEVPIEPKDLDIDPKDLIAASMDTQSNPVKDLPESPKEISVPPKDYEPTQQLHLPAPVDPSSMPPPTLQESILSGECTGKPLIESPPPQETNNPTAILTPPPQTINIEPIPPLGIRKATSPEPILRKATSPEPITSPYRDMPPVNQEKSVKESPIPEADPNIDRNGDEDAPLGPRSDPVPVTEKNPFQPLVQAKPRDIISIKPQETAKDAEIVMPGAKQTKPIDKIVPLQVTKPKGAQAKHTKLVPEPVEKVANISLPKKPVTSDTTTRILTLEEIKAKKHQEARKKEEERKEMLQVDPPIPFRAIKSPVSTEFAAENPKSPVLRPVQIEERPVVVEKLPLIVEKLPPVVEKLPPVVEKLPPVVEKLTPVQQVATVNIPAKRPSQEASTAQAPLKIAKVSESKRAPVALLVSQEEWEPYRDALLNLDFSNEPVSNQEKEEYRQLSIKISTPEGFSQIVNELETKLSRYPDPPYDPEFENLTLYEKINRLYEEDQFKKQVIR